MDNPFSELESYFASLAPNPLYQEIKLAQKKNHYYTPPSRQKKVSPPPKKKKIFYPRHKHKHKGLSKRERKRQHIQNMFRGEEKQVSRMDRAIEDFKRSAHGQYLQRHCSREYYEQIQHIREKFESISRWRDKRRFALSHVFRG